MAISTRQRARDPIPGITGLRAGRRTVSTKQLLGGRFRFESSSHALLDLVEAAFGGLPSHVLPVGSTEFRVELRLVPSRAAPDRAEPPPVQMQSGAGLLCAVMDASNYTVIAPAERRALVVASGDMLGHPYHLRYELIEFVVFILAARSMGLVPLHGACVGRRGRGLLLLGASGAGKSTLALHCLLQGLDLLSEDAVFVRPESMLATGIGNFLHVRAEALQFLDGVARHWIDRAPIIRRRSGVEKFEADMRLGPGRIAGTPLELVGAVLVSDRPADDPDHLLGPIDTDEIISRLSATQNYAITQPGWHCFAQRLRELGVHQLRRGGHPHASVDALRTILD